MRLVLTTLPTEGAAQRMGRDLVNRRLAACVSTLPLRSTYWWKGRVESARETLALFKTTDARSRTLVQEIRALHPYEVPEVLVLRPADVNPDYLVWLEKSLSRVPLKGSRRARAVRAPR